MLTIPFKLTRSISYNAILRNSSSNSTHSNNTTASSLPPKPAIDYNRIITNRNTYSKNLVDRKSHLTSDAIEDVAYLYNESKNLSKKLVEARQRQNSLGNKIKEAISHLTPAKEDQQKKLFPSKEEEELLLSSSPLSKNKTNELLQSSSNLELAAKVNDYHAEAAALKDAISNLSKDATALEIRLLELATQLPNETHPGVPVGSYDHSEIVSLSSGSKLTPDPLPFQSFEVPSRPPDLNRDHLKVMTDLGWLSFSDGQKTTGPSFPFLVGNGAFLELALIQYAVKLAVRSGWHFTIGPDIVRSELADRCGFSPRNGGESNHTYFISNNKSNQTNSSIDQPPIDHTLNTTHCLAATAEIPIIGSHHSTTLPSKAHPKFPSKPIQLVSLGTAFRAEAGSRGTDSRGLYRVHQFKKVELVAITDSRTQVSEKMLQKMVDLQVEILSGLNLPYRILEMSSEELGASAYHKYDIEVWMPGRGRWGEVTSASNCTDYQSRRLGIRSRARQQTCTGSSDKLNVDESEEEGATVVKENTQATKKSSNERPSFVHTLNATAAAIPRLIVGLVENGVVLDENHLPNVVRIPDVLKPHWLGDSRAIEWIPSSGNPHNLH